MKVPGGGQRKIDTVSRNFMQQNQYMSKTIEEMSERDWRIFREDNEISIKWG